MIATEPISVPLPMTRTPRALGTDDHRAGELVYCSICRLDRARRSRSNRLHRAFRERRLLHMTLDALR